MVALHVTKQARGLYVNMRILHAMHNVCCLTVLCWFAVTIISQSVSHGYGHIQIEGLLLL
jgi:hypothetical protein